MANHSVRCQKLRALADDSLAAIALALRNPLNTNARTAYLRKAEDAFGKLRSLSKGYDDLDAPRMAYMDSFADSLPDKPKASPAFAFNGTDEGGHATDDAEAMVTYNRLKNTLAQKSGLELATLWQRAKASDRFAIVAPMAVEEMLRRKPECTSEIIEAAWSVIGNHAPAPHPPKGDTRMSNTSNNPTPAPPTAPTDHGRHTLIMRYSEPSVAQAEAQAASEWNADPALRSRWISASVYTSYRRRELLGQQRQAQTPQPLSRAEAQQQAEREWEGDTSVRVGFSSKQNYCAFRSNELMGRTRVVGR